MPDLKEDIIDCLNGVKGTGSFVSSHVADFFFPGLQINGLEDMSYPINPAQARLLISKARKAPFGKGSKTLVDTTVRSAWEIDAAELKFTNRQWPVFLQRILATLEPDMGLETGSTSASLYKMLIYEKGDFFLPHQDTEKEKGMFGTLIIGLPAKHSGGELLVRFDGEETSVSFADDASHFRMPYVAFYADCVHEIKPITTGYRVCLVYNLVRRKAGKTPKPEALSVQINQLATVLKKAENKPAASPAIVLLGHQYTPEGYSMEGLKLNDRSRTEVLLKAASAAGYYARLCLVTAYQVGSPSGGGGYYHDEYDTDENAKMEEVIDESWSITHWSADGVPPLQNIDVEEENLIATVQLKEGEPIEKELGGYMGNYGPDLEHWYHYGAVILWPQKHHANLLLQQPTTNQLEWLRYYNSRQDELSRFEQEAAEAVLASGLEVKSQPYGEQPNYSVVAHWFINRNDEKYLQDAGSSLLRKYFEKIDISTLVQLAETFPAAFIKMTAGWHADCENPGFLAHYISLLNALAGKAPFGTWLSDEMKTLPTLLQLRENSNKSGIAIKKETWADILQLEQKLPQAKIWVNAMSEIVTENLERNYIHTVLVAVSIRLKQLTPLIAKVLAACRSYLQNSADNKPQPPEDWSRPVPANTGYEKQWAIIADFLHSPDQHFFEYRKNQHERDLLDNAIRNATVDLRTETIRKGSPHTLRLIKTKEAYDKQMQLWSEDVSLLEKVKEKLRGAAL